MGKTFFSSEKLLKLLLFFLFTKHSLEINLPLRYALYWLLAETPLGLIPNRPQGETEKINKVQNTESGVQIQTQILQNTRRPFDLDATAKKIATTKTTTEWFGSALRNAEELEIVSTQMFGMKIHQFL